MDLNKAAVAVTKKEGGKLNLSVAEVKQVIGCYHEVLAEQDGVGFVTHMSKMLTNGQKRLRSKRK